jgi:PAS domain S-box-containing protein
VSEDLEDLRRELADLRERVEVSEAIVQAIDRAEVDAFLVRGRGDSDEEVLVLGGADRPYRLLIERMQQGAATLSRDGAILYSNRRLAEMIGSQRPGLSGCLLSELVAERDRDVAALLVSRGCHETAECELSLATESGEELPVQLTMSPLLDESGLTCAVVTDLTRERAQQRQRERLSQESAARAAAERTAGILLEADRRKDVFLATLAHELRNPLAPLRNGLQALRLVRPEEADFQSTHDMLTRQIETLVRLVDDLLDVGRLTQGKIRLQRSRFDVRQAVDRAVETCQALLAERGHRLEVSAPKHALIIEADEVRVTQAITNLLNNAAKFTPGNGDISLAVEPAAGEAVVRVRDTGIGIPADLLGRIFEPFAQADTGPGRMSGGLGIGLTLARSLVEMHGGSISATSEGTGRGSEFVLRLPLADSQVAPVAQARPAPTQARGRARVLVVDDNRDAAQSLGVLLGRLGHEVRLEHSAPQVHASVLAFRPDVVLLDVGLPEMDGYDVARGLRADPRCRDVFIVGLSGFAAEADRAQARSAGFDEHRAKPIDLAELDRLLSRATSSPRATRRPPGAASSAASD